MYASISRGVASSSATLSGSTSASPGSRSCGARSRRPSYIGCGNSGPRPSGPSGSGRPQVPSGASTFALTRSSTVASGRSRSSTRAWIDSAESAGAVSAGSLGVVGAPVASATMPAGAGGGGAAARRSSAASMPTVPADRRASGPCGLASRRMAADTAAAGTRLAWSSASSVRSPIGTCACTGWVTASSTSAGRRSRRRSISTPSSSRASCALPSCALSSRTSPACFQASAISCSCRCWTTRAPTPAATRMRGSRLSSSSQPLAPACVAPYSGGVTVPAGASVSTRSSASWNGTRVSSGHGGGSSGPGGLSALSRSTTAPSSRGSPPPASLMSSLAGRDVSRGRGRRRRTSVSKLPAGPVANSQAW